MFNTFPTPDDSAAFVQLYSKLADSLGAAGVVGKNPASLISLQLPGVTVEPGLDPDDPATQYYVSNFLNLTLECNYVATFKAALVSDVYKLILDGKETPNIELTKEQKAELTQARTLLFDPVDRQPTLLYQRYVEYGQCYYAALDTFETDQQTARNGGEPVSQKVIDARDAALVQWQELGSKEQVDKALDVIQQLESRSPYAYWQALKERYDSGTRTLKNSSSFQEVRSLPMYKDWFNQDLWTPFRFDAKDYKHQRRSGGVGMQAGCACRCRHCGGQGNAAHTPAARHAQASMLGAWQDDAATEVQLPYPLDADRFELELSFKRINIIRPWMDSNVFYSRTWRWSPQSIGFGIDISTGGSVAGNQVAVGVMPVLPTTALLAKDIVVRTSCARTCTWLEEQFAKGKSVRYGPFRLSGMTRTAVGQLMASGQPVKAIASGAPQIFGYISTIFPQCPNPDYTLPWPNNQPG